MLCPSEDCDVRGLNFHADRCGERFAFELANAQVALPVLFMKFPAVETAARRIPLAENSHLAAETVEPELAFEIEKISGVLAGVELCHIVFAQSEFIERKLASIEIALDFDRVFVMDVERNTAIAPHAAQFGPASAAG